MTRGHTPDHARAQARARAAQRALGPALATSALLFGMLAIADVAFLREANAVTLALVNGATGIAFAVAYVAGFARRIAPEHANAAIAVMALTGLLNVTVGAALTGEGASVLAFALIIVASSTIIFSRMWASIVNVGVVAAWSFVALSGWVDASPGPATMLLLASLAVGAGAHEARLRVLDRWESLRADEANARAEAEAALHPARLSEARRARSEQKWRLLVENAPDTILLVDHERRITFVNRHDPRAQDADVVGRDLLDLIPPEHHALAQRALDDAASTRQAASYDIAIPGEDGQLQWFKSSVGVLQEGEGPPSFIIIATDITAQRLADEERVRAQERQREIERLKELDAYKTQFINTAAHELGTPLTPIRLQLHMLRRAPPEAIREDQQRALGILDRNVMRLENLVRDVLDSARVQAGRLAIRRDIFDVRGVAQEAVESFKDAAQDAGVAIAVAPLPDEPANVMGDPARVLQVMFNYLTNALKFTPRGGTVTLRVERDADAVRVLVTDTGMGFTAGAGARLFHAFTQIHDPASVREPGTGLGLFISRGIIEQQGGSTWCESDGPGLGATFGFSLPLAAPAAPAPATVER